MQERGSIPPQWNVGKPVNSWKSEGGLSEMAAKCVCLFFLTDHTHSSFLITHTDTFRLPTDAVSLLRGHAVRCLSQLLFSITDCFVAVASGRWNGLMITPTHILKHYITWQTMWWQHCVAECGKLSWLHHLRLRIQHMHITYVCMFQTPWGTQLVFCSHITDDVNAKAAGWFSIICL